MQWGKCIVCSCKILLVDSLKTFSSVLYMGSLPVLVQYFSISCPIEYEKGTDILTCSSKELSLEYN